ncbi:MAG: sulfatase [Cyclobacteriaceae bacterium]
MSAIDKWGIYFCLGILVVLSSCKSTDNKKLNILFIAIDDLRPELGCYGSKIAITPNIDRLASEGLLFNRAYCQQAICGPSRASLLTGMHPHASGIIHNYLKIRELHPNVVTLPQHFKENGYEAVYTGKIFHHGDKDDEKSWSRMPNVDLMSGVPKPVGFASQENLRSKAEMRKEMFAKYGDVAKYGLASGPAYENAEVPDNTFADGYNTELAIATMKEILVKDDKPFFLGLGLHKPHLNWVAPKKYWDLYDTARIELSSHMLPPSNGSTLGLHPSFELRVRDGIPKAGGFDPVLSKTLMQAYLACVSYVDAQIGKMIEALEESGQRENTIIILWSDHGYHLSDMGIWGKATNYEIATRVPMIIWTPDMPDRNRGVNTDALVELVDIYPSLCELAGLQQPDHLDGLSFVPLLKNPDRQWKELVLSQFPSPALREWGSIPLRAGMRETYFGPLIAEVEGRIQAQYEDYWDRDLFENDVMGYAIRTPNYRFIAWMDRKNLNNKPIDVELYDHDEDPDETTNIASSNPDLVQELLNQLRKVLED